MAAGLEEERINSLSAIIVEKKEENEYDSGFQSSGLDLTSHSDSNLEFQQVFECNLDSNDETPPKYIGFRRRFSGDSISDESFSSIGVIDLKNKIKNQNENA